MFEAIDNFFCGLEGKGKATSDKNAIIRNAGKGKSKKVLVIGAGKINSLGSAIHHLYVSKGLEKVSGLDGLDGWKDDKEKFKIDLLNDIKTFLFTKWEKPWKPGLIFNANGDIISGFRNIHGRVYTEQGNVMGLERNKGNSPFFITVSDLEKKGGTITDKNKRTTILSYVPISEEIEKGGEKKSKIKFMLPKFHSVINVDYVEGIKKPAYKTEQFKGLELNEYVENFIKLLVILKRVPKLIYDQSDRAYYAHSKLSWDNDQIHLVPINNFKNIEGYYSTLFHEIIHSTMNPKRCGRGKNGNTVKLDYPNEELVAEMGAMIICSELGLNYNRQNSISYLKGWLTQAGNDKDTAMIEAYAFACDAADYLMKDINFEKLVPKSMKDRIQNPEPEPEKPKGKAKKTTMKTHAAIKGKDGKKVKKKGAQQPKAWKQTKEEYTRAYREKIDYEYRTSAWKRQSDASKKRVNELFKAKNKALMVHAEIVAGEFAKGTKIPLRVLREYPELTHSNQEPGKKTSPATPADEPDFKAPVNRKQEQGSKDDSKSQEGTKNNATQLTLFGIDDVNSQFNRELEQLKDKKLHSKHVFKLGLPSKILTDHGIENKPIEMSAVAVTVKADKDYINEHPFELEAIKDLPKHLANPLAILNGKLGRKLVFISLQHKGHNFILTISLYRKKPNRQGENVVNSILSIFPKDNYKGLYYSFQKDLLWAEKTEMLRFIQDHEANLHAVGINAKHFANLIQNFENSKSLDGIATIEVEPSPINPLEGFGLAKLGTGEKPETYQLQGGLGEFLGEYDRLNYSIVLRGEKGAGKSRLLFQLIDAFAAEKLKIAFLSLEMHPDSLVSCRYRDEYIKPENYEMIDVTSQVLDYDGLNRLCKMVDVVAIDSWTKLKGMGQDDFDRLQKENPSTIILSVFQSTSGKVTRGGNMPEFDAGTVIQVNKGGLAECEKNRYTATDKIYSVFDRCLVELDKEEK